MRIKAVRHAKELLVKGLLDAAGVKYTSHDRMVDCDLTRLFLRYRPDFLFDCITHYLILEVDENQHKLYEWFCEQIRMLNLCQALGSSRGGKRTVFLRYNPDGYAAGSPSWNKPTLGRRHDTFLKCLKKMMEPRQGDDGVEAGEANYLFYDGFSGAAERVVFDEKFVSNFKN
jgi:hypothetical protein